MKKRLILPLFTSLTLSLSALAQTPDHGNEADKWLPNLTSVTSIDESTIQVNITEEQVLDLYDRYAQHYADFITDAKIKTVDFEFLMSSQNSKTAFELHYLFGLAMDKGLALAQFADFGYEPVGDGHYRFDLQTSPHLAIPAKLFGRLKIESMMSQYAKQLLQRGFRQSDLDIIQAHIKNHPVEKVTHRQSTLLAQHKLPSIKQMAASEKGLTGKGAVDYFQAWSYQNKVIKHNAWRNWGLSLLSKLDLKRQQILKPFLVEVLIGNISMGPTTKERTEEGLVMWAKAFKSGEVEQQIIKEVSLLEREGF